MAEHLRPTPEHRQPESEQASSAERRRRWETLERQGKAEAEQLPEQARQAQQEIARLKISHEQTPKIEHHHRYVSAERSAVKATAYQQTLKDIRRHLPSKATRNLSKFIHQPAVETVSDLAAKTVFRPSITLGAALGALLGGTSIYLLARHYGFALSGSEFLIFGAAGAVAGLLIELINKLFKRLFKKTS